MTDLARLRSLQGIKWSKYPPSVLPAWVADMDFAPASEVTEAISAMVDRGDLGYNFVALDALAETWAQWQQHRHGWSPPVEDLWTFTGAMHALEAIMVLDTRPGDGIVILTPIYEPFRTAIVESGRRVVDVPLDPDGWRLDPERLEAAVDAGTRAVLMCQPHNPTGRVFDATELAALADVVERRDLLVISDEIWGDLTHAPHRHLPVAAADERLAERTITVGSASKAFNITGLRCAVAHVGSARIRRALRAFPTHLLGSPSSLSAAATVAAWTVGEEWLEATRVEITARRGHLAERLAADGRIGYVPSEATYLAWLDFAATDLGEDPSKRLLSEAGVALEPGLRFGPQGAGWARLNFATSAELLDAVIDRILGRLDATNC
jgi:cystathionine beta-lyase